LFDRPHCLRDERPAQIEPRHEPPRLVYLVASLIDMKVEDKQRPAPILTKLAACAPDNQAAAACPSAK
jgi:hypothetical protein